MVLFTVFIAKCQQADASRLEVLELNDWEHLSWSLVELRGLNENIRATPSGLPTTLVSFESFSPLSLSGHVYTGSPQYGCVYTGSMRMGAESKRQSETIL